LGRRKSNRSARDRLAESDKKIAATAAPITISLVFNTVPSLAVTAND
jgi:hypothetical protein